MGEISVITQNNPVEFDKTRRELLKDFLCKSSKRGASNGELELFISTCERLQLDPFARQIFAVFRFDKRTGGEVMSIQTSIDGYRAIAERTGKYHGQEGPYWCGPDGVWKDVWLSEEFPSAAKVGVIKAGHTKPTWAVARWSSYVQRTKWGIAKMWESMPDLMLAKCFDEDTEVLTSNGFEKFSEVSGKVMQVTDEGLKETDSTPFSQEYSGPMIELDSDDLNFSVTPNHDMLTTEGKIEAGDMFSKSRSRPKFWIPRSVRSRKVDSGLFTDDQIVTSAIILADGYLGQSKKEWLLSLSRERKIDKVDKIGSHFYRGSGHKAGHVSRSTYGRTIVSTKDKVKYKFSMEAAPLVNLDKNVDTGKLLCLSRRQARLFTDTWIEFDGNRQNKSGVRRIYTSRMSHRKSIDLAAVLAGYSISNWKERTSDISSKPNYCATISDRDAIPVIRWGRSYKGKGGNYRDRTGIKKIDSNASGKVWCVTVPSGLIVVRRNGFSMICGNCAEALALRKAFPQDLSGVYTDVEMAQAEIIDVDTPVKEPEAKRYGDGAEITDVFIRPTEDTTITKETCPSKFYKPELEGKRLGDDQDEAVKDYQGKTYTFHLKDKKPDEVKAANSPREYEWLLGVHEVRKRRKAREEEELRELKAGLVREAKELALLSESNLDQLKEAYKLAKMRPVANDDSLESIDVKRLEKLIPAFIEAGKAASVGKPKAGTRRRSRVSANSRPRGAVGAVLREVRAPGKAERAAKAQVYREQITDHLRSVGDEEQSNQAWRDLCAVVAMPPTMPLHHFEFKVLKRMIEAMKGATV